MVSNHRPPLICLRGCQGFIDPLSVASQQLSIKPTRSMGPINGIGPRVQRLGCPTFTSLRSLFVTPSPSTCFFTLLNCLFYEHALFSHIRLKIEISFIAFTCVCVRSYKHPANVYMNSVASNVNTTFSP